MKLSNEKSEASARDGKRRLENPLTEAQKAKKAAADAERLRKIQRTIDRSSERLRAKVERRSVAGIEGLAAEAFRLSTRRKSHPLSFGEKAKKTRAEEERRSATRAELPTAQAARLSQYRNTDPLTVEQKAEKAVANRCNPLSTI